MALRLCAVIDELVANNRRHATKPRAALPAPPARRLAILTCIDCRIDVPGVFGLELGDAHIIRNAGALATDDAIRSLMVSQQLLGTTSVMVVGHTSCGLESYDGPLAAELGAFWELEARIRESVMRIRECASLPRRDDVRGFVLDIDTMLVREVAIPTPDA
jgi:carbonic anhydrase